MRVQPAYPVAPEPGQFNINVFWQADTWFDREAKPHKVRELDRDYARAIYDYALRRWTPQWNELHPLFPLCFTPLMQAVQQKAITGRNPTWRDRLRWYRYKRKFGND